MFRTLIIGRIRAKIYALMVGPRHLDVHSNSIVPARTDQLDRFLMSYRLTQNTDILIGIIILL